MTNWGTPKNKLANFSPSALKLCSQSDGIFFYLEVPCSFMPDKFLGGGWVPRQNYQIGDDNALSIRVASYVP